METLAAERMMRSQIACMIAAVVLSACQAHPLSPPNIPSDTRPIATGVKIGNAAVDDAERTEIKTVTFGEGPNSGRMVVTTRSVMDVRSEEDILWLRAEILDTDVTISGRRQPHFRNLIARLRETEGTIIEFDQDLQTGKASVRVIQHGAMVTLNGDAASKIVNLMQQSYLGGQSVKQGQEVMKLDLSLVLFGINPLAEEASLSGRVMGEAQFNGRRVIVVVVKGTINREGGPVQVVGTYLVDKSTGVPVRSDLAVAGLQMHEAEIRVAISQEVKL